MEYDKQQLAKMVLEWQRWWNDVGFIWYIETYRHPTQKPSFLNSNTPFYHCWLPTVKCRITLANSCQPCWYDKSIQGDPGRTLDINNATVFNTYEEAYSQLKVLIASYPNRQYDIELIDE